MTAVPPSPLRNRLPPEVLPNGGPVMVHHVALLAALAAAPSLIWSAVGGFLSDDWAIWAGFETRGIAEGLEYNAFTAPARPGAAALYSVIYGVFGPNPVVQGLLLAGLNAGLVIAAWYLGRLVLPARVLVAVLVFLALAPNHATTRLWSATATHSLALGLLFLAVGSLLRGRPAVAAFLLCAATAVHEGTFALGVAMVLLWAALEPGARWVRGLTVVVPAGVIVVLMVASSPKRGSSGPNPLNNIESFVPGQLGVGLWTHPGLARIGVLAIAGLVVAALARQLPSFRSERPEYRLILLGALLAAAGAAPYSYLGTTFATSGFFDRSNLVPSVGVALIVAAAWSLISARNRPLAALVAIVSVTAFTWGQVDDLRAFASAVDYGEDVTDALAAMPLDRRLPTIVLDAREPGGTGVAAFVYDGDLAAALKHQTGEEWEVILGENLRCDGHQLPWPAVQVVDWRERVHRTVDPAAVRTDCERWRAL